MKPLEEIIRENKEADVVDKKTDGINLEFVKIQENSRGVITITYNGHEAKLTETVLTNIVKLNSVLKYGRLKDFKANDVILNFLLRRHSSHAGF